MEGYTKWDIRYVPALHTAIDRLPKDITITNWYWYFGQDNGYTFDDTFKGHEVIMTNCYITNFKGWRIRVLKSIEILGMSCSNWGKNDYINVTHTTNHNIPWHSFNDGKFEGAKFITKEIKY